MTHPAFKRPKLRVVNEHYPLNTSHEARVLYISNQLQQLTPVRKQPEFDILWDLYLLSLERDQRDKGEPVSVDMPRTRASPGGRSP